MDVSKFREMNHKDLVTEMDRIEKDIMKLRMETRIGTAENPVAIREMKRDVARIKTVIRERELSPQS